MNSDDRPTPPSPIRAQKVGVVRRFMLGLHWRPIAKMAIGPLVAAVGSVMVARVQHSAGKAEADHKVKVAYETLAPATNEQAAEIAELKKAVSALADTVQLQGKLLLATQPGFTPAGKPEPPARRRARPKVAAADPKLVEQVQRNAVKDLQKLKERAMEPAPTAPLPPTLPKDVPTGTGGADGGNPQTTKRGDLG